MRLDFFFNFISNSIIMPIVALLTCIFVGYVLKPKALIEEMKPLGAIREKKNLPEYKKAVIRHELTHAFLFESGLDTCSWAQNEEMVDWIALQFPKLLQVFKEADCL